MTKKISVSLPDDVEQAARAAADEAGVPLSGWLTRAAQRYLQDLALMEDGRKAIEEHIAEHGPIEVTPEEHAWAESVLVSAGLIDLPRERAAG